MLSLDFVQVFPPLVLPAFLPKMSYGRKWWWDTISLIPRSFLSFFPTTFFPWTGFNFMPGFSVPVFLSLQKLLSQWFWSFDLTSYHWHNTFCLSICTESEMQHQPLNLIIIIISLSCQYNVFLNESSFFFVISGRLFKCTLTHVLCTFSFFGW